ncbi:MAG: hypothetical protein KF729_26065 [Sandaracinaceae bacterium]|nr:hypothetical protein [Sandaracinaceae bacterium]
MRRTQLALLLVAASAGAAAAQPPHCERPVEPSTWPAPGDPIGAAPTAPPSPEEARRFVDRFRAAYRGIRHRDAVLRAYAECMEGYAHFVVRRVEVGEARRSLALSTALAGDASRLPATGWVWEVYWGGASRRFPPSGPVSGYLTPDGRNLLLAVQWREG